MKENNPIILVGNGDERGNLIKPELMPLENLLKFVLKIDMANIDIKRCKYNLDQYINNTEEFLKNK